MHRDFFTSDRLKTGYYSYLVAIMTVIILPVYVWYLPPCMVLWFLVWLVENHSRINETWKNNKAFNTLFILFVLYYLWQAFSLTYTNNVKLGLSNLFGRLSLVLFPLVLLNPGETIKLKVKELLRIFAISAFLFVVVCFCFAFVRSVSWHDGHLIFNPHPHGASWLNYFYSSDLTIIQHPSYIAMYVLLALFICFESWYDKSIVHSRRIWWLIIGFLLLISQYFLSSRAGILISILLVPVYFIFKLRRTGKSKFAWIAIILCVILLIPVIAGNQRVDYLSGWFTKKTDYPRKQDPRLIVWKSALNVAKKHLLFGVGIGDVRTELINEYSRIGEDTMARDKLNAHNQFLEILVETGVIGVVIFLLLFTCMIWIVISEKNVVYGLFICIVFIFFQFESMLYRLAGVTFFSLFSFLLMHAKVMAINNFSQSKDGE